MDKMVQRITLEVPYDPDADGLPQNWDWTELADSGAERVCVISAEDPKPLAQEWSVTVGMLFEAVSAEDAVRQMVAFLADNYATAGYRAMLADLEPLPGPGSKFIDAEDLDLDTPSDFD